MAKALDEIPLDDWKLKLKWNLLRSSTPFLNKAMVDENFRFYSQISTASPSSAPLEARRLRRRRRAGRGRRASFMSTSTSRPKPRPG